MKVVNLNIQQIRELAEFVGLSVAVPDGLATDTRYHLTNGHVPAFEADNGEIVPAYSGLIAWTRDLPEDKSGVLILEAPRSGMAD
jgi:hypothetical protein